MNHQNHLPYLVVSLRSLRDHWHGPVMVHAGSAADGHQGAYEVAKRIEEVREKDRLQQFKSPVDGHEIMKILGIPEGRAIGILKFRIEEAILVGIIPNDHDAAFEYLMKIKDDVLHDHTA